MKRRHIDPAVLVPLKDALTAAFWYRNDLRAFVQSTVSDTSLVARIDWSNQYKRTSVNQLVEYMNQNQHKYFDDLLNLILCTADLTDPQHLRRLDNGEAKYRDAAAAIATLAKHVEPLRGWRDARDEAGRRREAERHRQQLRQAISQSLGELRTEYQRLITLPPQERGYALEGLLNRLFEVFDIESKGSFQIRGEQIDGAFTFENIDFLLESKWQKDPVERAHLDIFSSKVERKLENTLGLFVAINGFQSTAVASHSSARPSIILMDGSDLMAVLEERIELPELLRRKRKHAAQTGEIYSSAFQMLE